MMTDDASDTNILDEPIITLGLEGLHVRSGTAKDGDGDFRGFCVVEAEGPDGNILAGHIDPDNLRAVAFQFLEVAEAADQDAIVMTMLVRDLQIPEDAAAGFITHMREEREKQKEKRLERHNTDGSLRRRDPLALDRLSEEVGPWVRTTSTSAA